jgi:hypothetical protein
VTLREFGIVFVAMVLLDVVFAYYIIDTAAKYTVAASAWAAAIQVCNAVVVVSFVKTWKTVFPAALGAFFGTYLAIQWVT